MSPKSISYTNYTLLKRGGRQASKFIESTSAYGLDGAKVMVDPERERVRVMGRGESCEGTKRILSRSQLLCEKTRWPRAAKGAQAAHTPVPGTRGPPVALGRSCARLGVPWPPPIHPIPRTVWPLMARAQGGLCYQ